MESLTTLAADVWHFLVEFGFSGPVTVEKVGAWIAFVVALSTTWRFLKRQISAARAGYPISKFILTARDIESTRQFLERLEREGFFDPRSQTLVLVSVLWNGMLYTIIGVAAFIIMYEFRPGTLSAMCGAIIGSTLPLMRTGSYFGDAARTVAGRRSKITRRIEQAERYLLDAPPSSDVPHRGLRKELDRLRSELPLLKATIQRIRNETLS
jgi:hypothetical protein